MCLLVCVAAACGDTNNIDARAGRDGKVCVDGAVCDEATERAGTPAPPDAAPPAGSPSGDGTPDGDGAVGGDGDENSALGPGPGDADGVTPDARADVRVRHLTDIGPVGGYGNNVRERPSRLGGTALTRSIVFTPVVFNKAVKRLTFNVPAGLTGFRATVGLDEETLPDYVAHVGVERRDGTTLTSLTLRAGEVHDVSEDVTGAGAVTISVSVLEWASDAVNSRPHVVLGDGRFVK